MRRPAASRWEMSDSLRGGQAGAKPRQSATGDDRPQHASAHPPAPPTSDCTRRASTTIDRRPQAQPTTRTSSPRNAPNAPGRRPPPGPLVKHMVVTLDGAIQKLVHTTGGSMRSRCASHVKPNPPWHTTAAVVSERLTTLYRPPSRRYPRRLRKASDAATSSSQPPPPPPPSAAAPTPRADRMRLAATPAPGQPALTRPRGGRGVDAPPVAVWGTGEALPEAGPVGELPRPRLDGWGEGAGRHAVWGGGRRDGNGGGRIPRAPEGGREEEVDAALEATGEASAEGGRLGVAGGRCRHDTLDRLRGGRAGLTTSADKECDSSSNKRKCEWCHGHGKAQATGNTPAAACAHRVSCSATTRHVPWRMISKRIGRDRDEKQHSDVPLGADARRAAAPRLSRRRRRVRACAAAATRRYRGSGAHTLRASAGRRVPAAAATRGGGGGDAATPATIGAAATGHPHALKRAASTGGTRWCPTAGGGGDTRRLGAAAAILRDRSDGRHATGGGGSDAAAAAGPLRQRRSRIRLRQLRVAAGGRGPRTATEGASTATATAAAATAATAAAAGRPCMRARVPRVVVHRPPPRRRQVRRQRLQRRWPPPPPTTRGCTARRTRRAAGRPRKEWTGGMAHHKLVVSPPRPPPPRSAGDGVTSAAADTSPPPPPPAALPLPTSSAAVHGG
ncbi:LOW QUALITY PROTEIN: hypothetical protein BU14_0023s0075 [Porphyra umbilicalis]|uniref:Uncharacterized protein n=1 Tax=Porphyra umbilicalis TaxID=2786 RepID=A0A1X6PK89_PORUM|nr:LOW QUALITY PROTEIN: hypothetical protein BU14_0023s0075 [Porphyra umbilicalis]|eukprot:OSX81271.1 LOW QUALITY PROTEIN: hypothetical protein BU14_0023s0075 [Porphyra umbilicalis]